MTQETKATNVATKTKTPFEWVEAELQESVRAYLEIVNKEANAKEGEKVNRSNYYAKLAELFGRHQQAYNARLQNITATLRAEGIENLMLGHNTDRALARDYRKVVLTAYFNQTKQAIPEEILASFVAPVKVTRTADTVLNKQLRDAANVVIATFNDDDAVYNLVVAIDKAKVETRALPKELEAATDLAQKEAIQKALDINAKNLAKFEAEYAKQWEAAGMDAKITKAKDRAQARYEAANAAK